MKKVLSGVFNAVLWVFLIFAILMTVLTISASNSSDGISNINGKGVINIVSDSMNPTFKAGDIIICNVLSVDERADCKKGDVITFYSDLNDDGINELNTHRIVDVQKDGGYTYYTTKGDNEKTNPVNDETPVMNTQVVGKYDGQKFAKIGNVMTFLQKPVGFLCCIVIPLVIFFIFELYNFIMLINRYKNKGKVSKEEEEEIKKRAIEEYLKEKENSKED